MAAVTFVPPASAEEATVTSFDGTPIVVHFFPAAGLPLGARAPTVMVGPGWSEAGDTNPDDSTLGPLRRAGYNVLTWDPRGFGGSGGTVEVDSPSFEGRDVSALIDFIARQPQALLDGPNDPRVGMAGGSYGGGIQLVSAAIDHRIDAIVPEIAWHSLTTSLDKDGAIKSGWSNLLYAAAARDRLDPHLASAHTEAQSTGAVSADDVQFFASRGPGALVRHIQAPTLLVQGTVDDLFTLQEAVTNYEILRADGVPTKMVWFCGGHGDCDFNPGDTGLVERDTLAWLARYLKRQQLLSTGPGFEWVDQDGGSHHAAAYPLRDGRPLVGHGSGTLELTAAGGSGPLADPSATDVVAAAARASAPSRAANAVNVTIPISGGAKNVVGAPALTLTYQGKAPEPRGHVLAQIVDNKSGRVLGNQITPIPVVLDGARRTVSRPLEIIAATARPGDSFTLQLVADSTAYDLRPQGGAVSFSRIGVRLPVAASA